MSEQNKTRDAGLKMGKFLLLIALVSAVVASLYMMPLIEGCRPLINYGFRVLIIVLALGAWFLSQSLIAARSLESGEITDGLHLLSAPLHKYLLENRKVADRLLIASSGFIDLFGIFLIGISIFGPTMRPFIALLIVFIMRQVCQALCALPVPRDMIWRNPGFPSLLVTYGTSNDFFFSGHTAIALLGAVEIARIAPLWLAVAASAIAVLEAIVVIVLRAHYTMDIFGAIAAAFCAISLAQWICGGS